MSLNQQTGKSIFVGSSPVEYKVPCDGCICVPMCRHKTYFVFAKCSLISKWIMKRRMETPVIGIRPFYWRVEIGKSIEPTRWEVDDYGFFKTIP